MLKTLSRTLPALYHEEGFLLFIIHPTAIFREAVINYLPIPSVLREEVFQQLNSYNGKLNHLNIRIISCSKFNCVFSSEKKRLFKKMFVR